MKKISDLGITGKKLLFEGFGFLIVGILLLIYGPSFPELMLHVFLIFLAARELWNFLFRWFSKAAATCKCSSFRFISSSMGLAIFEMAGSSRPKLERKSFADVCVVGCRSYLLH